MGAPSTSPNAMTDETLPPDDAAAKAAQQAISGARKTSGRRTRASLDADVAAEADPAAAVEARLVKPLGANSIKLLEFAGSTWKVFVPREVTVDDLSDPQLWFAARQFQPDDLVHVIGVDYYAMALVTAVGPGRTTVSVLFHAPLNRLPLEDGAPGAVLPAGYIVRPTEPGSRSPLEVFRPHDRVVVSKGTILRTMDEATRFASDLAAALQRDAMRAAAGRRR